MISSIDPTKTVHLLLRGSSPSKIQQDRACSGGHLESNCMKNRLNHGHLIGNHVNGYRCELCGSTQHCSYYLYPSIPYHLYHPYIYHLYPTTWSSKSKDLFYHQSHTSSTNSSCNSTNHHIAMPKVQYSVHHLYLFTQCSSTKRTKTKICEESSLNQITY